MTENTSDQISLSDTSICRECQAELHCTCMKVSKFVDESKKKITIDQRLEIDNSLPLTDAYFTNIGGD
jgi:positive regulator of sigma E activity